LQAPHPLATRLLVCSVAQVGRAGLRHSADPADPAVHHPVTSADPPDQAVPRRATSTTPTVRTSADPTTTTGDHRGTQGTTTGAAASTAPRGAMICRRGAGVRRRRRRGMDRCQKRGGLRRHRSTTGASRSNPSGIQDSTSGASGSSGSGFRSRSDLREDGRLGCAGRSSAQLNSLERVADRQVLESADEDRRDVLRVAAGELDRLQPRNQLGEEAVDFHPG
jgi:hypothetical protein